MFACALVVMVTNSRLVYSMARDERLPLSEVLVRVPRSTGGPIWATVLAGCTSGVIVMAFSRSPDALAQLLGSSALLPALLYLGTVVIFVLTHKNYVKHADDFSLGRWQWPVVISALVWLLLEVALLALPEEFRSAQRYVAGTMLVGAVVYVYALVTRPDAMRREPGKPVSEL